MKAARGAKHLIFKTCIAAGFALGIILLWQTISTYEYVSGNMLMQAAQRDAEQKRAALQRTLRTSASPQTTSVTEAIIDSLDADARIAGHYRLDAVRGHLYERSGDFGRALQHFRRAAERTANAEERDYLTGKALGASRALSRAPSGA